MVNRCIAVKAKARHLRCLRNETFATAGQFNRRLALPRCETREAGMGHKTK